MRRHRAFSLLMAAFVLATPLRASAGDEDRALELFQASEREYRLGHFDEAAKLLLEARRLKREPVLLDNLARAYDGAGRKREAIQSFEEYLHEDPNAKDGPGIRARVATLKKEVAEREALEQKAGTTVVDPTKVERDKKPSAAPWVVAGAGALLFGGGCGLSLSARSRHEDATHEPTQAAAASMQEQAEARATAATVLVIAGGVIAGAGITWGVFDVLSSGKRPSHEPGSTSVTGYASPFGAGIVGVF